MQRLENHMYRKNLQVTVFPICAIHLYELKTSLNGEFYLLNKLITNIFYNNTPLQ